jgi:putative transposase
VFAHNALKQKENQAMAHSSTIFSQLLQLVSKHYFKRIEQEGFKPGRKPRSLTRWGQFVAMMFAHLSGRSSLRDIASQLGAQARRLYHLGVKGVKRSTPSDANQDRPAEFFESVFHHLYAKTPDLVVARLLNLPPGSITVFDRTYIDFAWFGSSVQNAQNGA